MRCIRAPRVGSKRILQPVGLLDLRDERVTVHTGHTVEVTQPVGCPENGMGQCYVDCVTCGLAKAELLSIDPAKSRIFVGMVLISSLTKEGTK